MLMLYHHSNWNTSGGGSVKCNFDPLFDRLRSRQKNNLDLARADQSKVWNVSHSDRSNSWLGLIRRAVGFRTGKTFVRRSNRVRVRVGASACQPTAQTKHSKEVPR